MTYVELRHCDSIGVAGMKRFRIFLIIVSAIVILWAVTIGVRNHTELARYEKPVGRCTAASANSTRANSPLKARIDRLGVGLASSGGGSRAAYLTAAILREIHQSDLRINVEALGLRNAQLLDQIGFVSSVSGGSLAAAYFVKRASSLIQAPARSPSWNQFLDKMAISFRHRQWYRELISSPSLWWKFWLTNYNRGSLARDDYDRTLFDGAMLADLPDKPVLYVNSFDVGNNIRFVISKHDIDTGYYRQKWWRNKLSDPLDLTGSNDTSFVQLSPDSVRLADAVYASSAYPVAYPNLAIKHCGRNKIAFQGQLIFLADGGLADNSGLVTLMTQMKAALKPSSKRNLVLALSIDSTLNRIDTNGSRFQRQKIEKEYAWRNTYVTHGIESIESAISLVHDLSWKFVERTGVVTDQIRYNWDRSLLARTGKCGEPSSKALWDNAFESGSLALRPLVLRLGLRDAVDGNLVYQNLKRYARLPEFKRMLMEQGLSDKPPAFIGEFKKRLLSIKTDFVLSNVDRQALDLAAYILVNWKLKDDLIQWSRVTEKGLQLPSPQVKCPN